MTTLLHQVFVQRRELRTPASDFRTLAMMVVVVAAGCSCGDGGCVLVVVLVAMIFASMVSALLSVLAPIVLAQYNSFGATFCGGRYVWRKLAQYFALRVACRGLSRIRGDRTGREMLMLGTEGGGAVLRGVLRGLGTPPRPNFVCSRHSELSLPPPYRPWKGGGSRGWRRGGGG